MRDYRNIGLPEKTDWRGEKEIPLRELASLDAGVLGKSSAVLVDLGPRAIDGHYAATLRSPADNVRMDVRLKISEPDIYLALFDIRNKPIVIGGFHPIGQQLNVCYVNTGDVDFLLVSNEEMNMH